MEQDLWPIVFDEEMSLPEPAAVDGGTPRLLRLPSYIDARGGLTVADGEALPFSAARYFVVRDVPAGAVRAQHAQRRSHELLSCVAGACTVELWWRGGNEVHRLADPDTALHVPPRVWVECREFSEDALLLVLCSRPYDPEDQMTDFGEFRAGNGE
jgi:UDP-2-acetamido-3-amino-2,3-dideoxy-glucuronate N-acetyltransferase